MTHVRRCVFPEWIMGLTMQQQSVLMLASRGPDGIAKYHPCKDIVRAYRATVFKAAFYGRALEWGERADSFMSLDLIADATEWENAVKAYFSHVDQLPHHYHMHLLHGAQILGYKHPDMRQRHAWLYFYQRACDDAHMNEETEEQMDGRLSDWFQEHWLCQDEGCPQAGTDHVCITRRDSKSPAIGDWMTFDPPAAIRQQNHEQFRIPVDFVYAGRITGFKEWDGVTFPIVDIAGLTGMQGAQFCGPRLHQSDCAIYNEPAARAGECDCGAALENVGRVTPDGDPAQTDIEDFIAKGTENAPGN